MKEGDKPSPGSDWPTDLSGPVTALPDHSRVWIAFSGGLDSTLLLRVAAACHGSVTALHINHQLQPDHEQTEQFCRAVCQALGVRLVIERVDVPVGCSASGGLEQAARDARYRVFRSHLQAGDLLLMAHHADDQAETVLFRLLRGSGVDGLSGMPAYRPLGEGSLFRPWLDISRERLEQVAADVGLDWIEDASNRSEVHDRNYLRHSVMPGLKQRWPELLKRMSRSAGACADSARLNRRLAELRWQECGDGRGRIRLDRFRQLDEMEQRNLIRWWIEDNGWPVPSMASWRQVLAELLDAADDRAPELRGEGFTLRRYRGRLYLVPEVTVPGRPAELRPGQPLRWGAWTLRLEPMEDGASPETPVLPIRVSTRQGGERVKPSPGRPSRALKTWLQEQGVPPWERARLPLVYEGAPGAGELVAIGNLWCSERYSGSAPAAGWRLVVEREFD